MLSFQLKGDPSTSYISCVLRWPYVHYFAPLASPLLNSLLKYVHEMNITHRDLKPENILLLYPDTNSDPIVKIADFGLAKVIHELTILQVSRVYLPIFHTLTYINTYQDVVWNNPVLCP